MGEAAEQVETKTEEKLLNLSAKERVVGVKFAGRSLRVIFRPLTLKDWIEYSAALGSGFVQRGDEWTPESNEREAACKLWDAALAGVEDLSKIPAMAVADPRWKTQMPIEAISAAAGVLQEVRVRAGGDPFAFDADARTVRLEATWNELVFDELVHIFRVPTRNEALQYKRVSVSYFRVAGSRRGEAAPSRVRVALRLKPLCDLYDSLIQEVHGYAGYARPQDMDPIHKLHAVGGLFEPPESEASTEDAA